jgi:hypothetical protein
MKIDITIEDYGIIINALHYYKKVEKKGNFQQYDDKRINELRDKLHIKWYGNNDKMKDTTTIKLLGGLKVISVKIVMVKNTTNG